jgi:high frequency lysogenization protein
MADDTIRFRDRTLALAGVFQAARLTQQLARDGQADRTALAAASDSILKLDAESTEDVYGGMDGVKLGLELLRDKLGGEPKPLDVEIARYVITIMQVESVLRRKPEILQAIRRGIETIENQMRFFAHDDADTNGALHPALAEKLAELYTRTVSTLKPRVLVNGEHTYLSNPLIAAKIRTALFAGIRSAVLWRQKGGTRWQLLFSRRKIGVEAARLLAELHAR